MGVDFAADASAAELKKREARRAAQAAGPSAAHGEPPRQDVR